MFHIKEHILRPRGPKIKRQPSIIGRWKYTFALGLIILSTITASLSSFDAFALNKTTDLSPGDQAKSYAYYLALRHCMSVGWFRNSTFVAGVDTKNSNMSASDAQSWNFFNDHVAVGVSLLGNGGNVYAGPGITMADNSVTVGVINEPTDGDTTCSTNNTNWLKAAAALWGYTTGPDLLCALKFTRDVDPNSCSRVVPGVPNDFKLAHSNDAGTNAADVDRFWKSLGNTSTSLDSITSGQYLLYYGSFTAGCGVLPWESGGSVDYTIQTFAPGATTPSPGKYTIVDRTKNTGTSVRIYQDTNLTCQQLADKLKSATSDAVKSFGLYLSKNNGNTTGTVCGEVGVKFDSSGKPCPVVPGDTSASSCTVQGIGWIICPVVTFLAGVSDGIFGFLSTNFLNTSPTLVAQGGNTYNAWSAIRTIANVAFVIVFLIIIFSQLTGVGVSNYGVKKMLPRVIIAAVLVNVSFYVCAVAVDLSNILGHSLKDLLTGLGAQINDSTIGDTATNPLSGGNSFANVAGSVLVVAGTAIAGYALIGSIIPVLLAAVVALLMIFFLLIGREVIIVLLIVLSPLAFVSYLLPNTETWFKKWRQALVAMLMLFPIISVVYGVSSLASSVIGSAFSANVAGDSGNLFGQIVGAAVLVIPLFAVPILLKKSLDGIPAVGKFMSGLSSRANGSLRKRVGESYQQSMYGRGKVARNAARNQYFQNQSARRTSKGGLNAVLSQGTSALGIPLTSQKAQREGVMRNARSTVATAQAEELKQATAPLANEIAQWRQNNANVDDMLEQRAFSKDHSEIERAAAVHQLAAMGRSQVLRNIEARADPKLRTVLEEAKGANAGALVNKAPDIIKGQKGAFGSVTGEQLASFTPDTAKSQMDYISSLYKSANDPATSAADRARVSVELNDAVTAFNSAVTDITANSSLQAAFNGATGNQISQSVAAISAADPSFTAFVNSSLHGLAAIQADGKIR
jgi:hypothetical protein